MKKIILLIFVFAQFALAQSAPARYEAEVLKNPNKGGDANFRSPKQKFNKI